MSKILQIFEFGDVEFDEALQEVRRDGEPVSVPPRSLHLLRYLIEHRDRVVPKNELLDAVWAGVAVGDAALAGALRDLRRAIGDDGEQQRWLQTKRGRGYRFAGALTARPALASRAPSEPAASAPPGPADTPSRSAPPEILGNLPALPRLVVGREEDLQAVRAQLLQDGPALCAVHGWPGVGKTTLAALLARDPELARRYPDGVLWASLGPRPDAYYELRQWARALHRASLLDECSSAAELAQRLRRCLSEARMLLILDDVWQIPEFELMRIGGEACGSLVTTRLPRLADALARGHEAFKLGLLSKERSLELLGTLVPAAVERYPEGCARMIEALEGLPLAVHVAAGLIKAEIRRGFSVDDVLKELLDTRRIHDAEAPSDLVLESSAKVAAVIERSTQSLDSVTRERFAALGVFVEKPAVFDERAICSAWDVSDPRESLAELVDRGLLEAVGAGRYQMHALLKSHAEALLEQLG